ncbi:hypothetical protein J6500_09875 [Bradyrhizobium sp. WSM 1704]|uniref:hypothetical protein n=1 Tax=Bradyrhizobium semiaridum TaxID=2821404 RepID=UPI001CE31671|nr:hypothetical protein [Bradyrhizobium semiaridum]MCA6122194.1 hypothetical protein [Bradyrhizobium semiaridum]
MGALLPVGSGPDAEIVDRLNELFSGTELASLRRHNKKEKLFDANHRLWRVAFRIGAYPSRDYGSDDAKRKWFFFLHHVLTQDTQDAIKRILGDAMTRSAIRAVKFSVEENSQVRHPHLFPSNNEPLANYLNTAGNTYLVHLVVKGPMDDSAEDPPGDNDPDHGEQPISWPKLELRRPAFRRTKSGRGKRPVKKKVGSKRKAGKKAAKRPRKR